MADIFISYASEDRDHAQTLAEAFESLGWSVSWDRTIPAGRKYTAVIDEELRRARSLVVLWSSKSIHKDWVLEEAEEGRQREILIPVLIEAVQPPRGFRLYQAADLSAWNGEPAAPSFGDLIADVSRVLDASATDKSVDGIDSPLRRSVSTNLGSASPELRVFAAPAISIPPFPVEAFVVEQDRDLVLDPESVIKEPRESLKSLIETAQNTKGRRAGSVLVTGSSVPYCFLAIVHDLTEDPTWKEQWIAEALHAVVAEAEKRNLKSIGIPLLGTVHGRLPARRSIELLEGSLGQGKRVSLRNIWVLTPMDFEPGMLQPLAEAGYKISMPSEC